MIENSKIVEFNKRAWGSSFFGLIRRVHPDNFPSKFFKYPKAFGYMWISFGKNSRLRAKFTLVPFNWIFRKFRDLYLRIKFGKSAEYSQLVYAKQAGFKEGIETAIAITKQFDNLEEVRARLIGCL